MRGAVSLAKNILLSNTGPLKRPCRMTFIITEKCNLKCSMCGIWEKESKDELTADEIDSFFKTNNFFNWINISGGEIFLRKDIRTVFSSINTHCKNLYLLDFPTNGFMTETITDTVEYLLLNTDIPRIAVTVSLDGPPHLHDRIRGVKGSWRKAVNTFMALSRIKAENLKLFFGMTLGESNIHSIDATLNSLKEFIPLISPDDLHINLPQTSAHYYSNMSLPGTDRKELIKALDTIKRNRNFIFFNPVHILERAYLNKAVTFLNTGKCPVPCRAGDVSFFMGPDGTIYPCSIFDLKLANIREHDYNIMNIWNNRRRIDTRNIIQKKKCPQCWSPCEAYQSILGRIIDII